MEEGDERIEERSISSGYKNPRLPTSCGWEMESPYPLVYFSSESMSMHWTPTVCRTEQQMLGLWRWTRVWRLTGSMTKRLSQKGRETQSTGMSPGHLPETWGKETGVSAEWERERGSGWGRKMCKDPGGREEQVKVVEALEARRESLD